MTTPFDTFVQPPTEFGIIPLWFWNDDLQEAELLRQVHEFHRAGLGGFIPHPRVGLSHRIGYLTPEYFRLVRLCVAEAAKLGMKVILYDEGCYPSGSACGQVVAENPDYVARCIGMLERDVTGPADFFWRPNTGRALNDQHVCTVLARVDEAGRVDPGSLKLLDVHPHDIVRVNVPAGTWKVMSVWHTHAGGHIRGVFAEHECDHATAPPAGDILNPEAVACFLRLTHDQYHYHLKDYFGSTIIGMFTDEPSPLGKGPYRFKDAKPFTPGFVEWLSQRLGKSVDDIRRWLPALWVDLGPQGEAFRRQYDLAVHARLHEVFYAGQARWCEAHGIALTGHPQWSNELSSMRVFGFPGQDMVWRYVTPGSESAMRGANSVAPKAATSAARISNRRRILTETCGAYGWRHTLDEMKWLLDWHLVRGNNLINMHAAFYSIAGRRAWESEPDIGVHNAWWPYFDQIAMYVRRMSWLLCDGEHVCDVAILGDGNALPWDAAGVLLQHQVDFLYVDDRAVGEGTVRDGALHIGSQAYRAVIIEGSFDLSAAAKAKLDQFVAAGGKVIRYQPGSLDPLIHAPQRDLRIDLPTPDLRFIHYRKAALDFYVLVNEGESNIQGQLTVRAQGAAAWWDPWSGTRSLCTGHVAPEGLAVELTLGRRESKVLAIDPSAPFEPRTATKQTLHRVPLEARWRVETNAGAPVNVPAPGDWARSPGFELFTGTLIYRATIEAPATKEAWLDLGQVGDIADVRLDGKRVGVRMWAPYRVPLGTLTTGRHELEIRVTNSMANEYDGAQLPSGLIGPIALELSA